MQCYWNTAKKEVEKNFAPQPLNMLDCVQTNSLQVNRVLTVEEEDCLIKLRTGRKRSILFKHSTGTCSGPSKKGCERFVKKDADIERVLNQSAASSFLQHLTLNIPVLKECCKKMLNMLQSDNIYEAATVPQQSEEWFKFRRLRVTGSVCCSIYTYAKTNWETKSRSVFFPKKFSSVATRHGTTYEKNALLKYQELNLSSLKLVTNIGLVICKQFPWFGFSPDAVVLHENEVVKLVEVKCPLTGIVDCVVEIMVTKCKYIETKDGIFSLKKGTNIMVKFSLA